MSSTAGDGADGDLDFARRALLALLPPALAGLGAAGERDRELEESPL